MTSSDTSDSDSSEEDSTEEDSTEEDSTEEVLKHRSILREPSVEVSITGFQGDCSSRNQG